MSIQIDGKLSFFKLAAGFSKAVDPESGMTVNLVHVNEWLGEVIRQLSQGDHASEQTVLQFAEKTLKEKSQALGAVVSRVQITAEDHSIFAIDASGFSVQTQKWSTHTNGQRVLVKETRWSHSPNEKPDRVEILDPLTGTSFIQS